MSPSPLQHDWLHTSLIYLAAAVVAVPLARWAGLGAVLGYLAAGVALGPWGLGLVVHSHDMLHFAEFGVVLMLFLVGLELEPHRLWALRRPIFGWGGLQLLGSTALLWGALRLGGMAGKPALAVALGLAMSSTAIGLAVLRERNLSATGAGRNVLSVMLLQDIAAIPILALLPLLGAGLDSDEASWSHLLRAVGMVLAIVVGGRLLLRPALRWIARSGTPEVFTAAALLLVVATAALMRAVDLSMALGAFLAGVLLAESEYRHQLETDLEPFKGLLLGLFFMAVGMGIDFAVVMGKPWVVLAGVLTVLGLKALLLWGMARGMGIAPGERAVFTLLLAQGGEFGFVVFQAAAQERAVSASTASLATAVVTLTMALTPLLLLVAERLNRRLAGPAAAPGNDPTQDLEPQAPVLIAGFGRYGQIVGRLLYAAGYTATVLEHDADQVATIRRFGWRVFWGDATRLDLLRTAGAAQAQVLVVAVDDMGQSLRIVDLAQAHFPHLRLVVRARNVQHWHELRRRGVEHLERETFNASLASGRSVLTLLGLPQERARALAGRFRQHNQRQLEAMTPHYHDEDRLLALSKAGRQQLEALFAAERALYEKAPNPAGWAGRELAQPQREAQGAGHRSGGRPPRPTRPTRSGRRR
ncbi:glutathione-regulated potassium-efflux system protein KefC [Ideonella livida]|uniref:Glutathione-regulated potassium-efflux system protein KefC n=1 Tax=Ideonella livida TaxID=2707176 RepID=A0A7C9TLF0_9BURK|nr:glutathione-regulated potassium-efflux system protein KefC [Ideonella livida]NDY92404.1 glutathione-regulated potassium-efflux system protein KefC [Ideonella livida]